MPLSLSLALFDQNRTDLDLVSTSQSQNFKNIAAKEFCNTGRGLSAASLRRLHAALPLQTSLVLMDSDSLDKAPNFILDTLPCTPAP